MFLLGAIYAYGVVLPALMADFGWNRSTAALPQSVLLFVYAIGMGVGGLLQDRANPTGIAIAGGALFGLGLRLAGEAGTLGGLILTYGIMAAIGFGFTYVAAVTAAMKSLPARRGLAAGIVVGAFGLGAFVWAPLVQHYLPTVGWQGIFAQYGGICLILLPFLGLGIRTARHPHDVPGAHPTMTGLTLCEALRTRVFWLVFAAYLLVTAVGLMLLAHLVNYAGSIGIPALQAAFLLSILSVGSGAGRIIMGSLSDRIGRFSALLGVTVVEVMLLCALAVAGSSLTVFVISALAGFVFGTWLTLYGPVSTDLFGLRAAGAVYGVLYLSYGLGGLLGPTLGGTLADAVGSYRPVFLAGALLCAIGAAFFYIAMRQHPPFYPHPPALDEEFPV